MKDGLIRVACATPTLSVANTEFNTKCILEKIDQADQQKINILSFPELSITGATCADLFFNDALIAAANNSLKLIVDYTKEKYPIVVVGLPFDYNGKLYNCLAVINNGEILGVVPKNELLYNDKRYFSNCDSLEPGYFDAVGIDALFAKCITFKHKAISGYTFTVNAGFCKVDSFEANLVINCAAIPENIETANDLQLFAKAYSKQNICALTFCNASSHESTQDNVFSGSSIICENGCEVSYKKPFDKSEMLITEVDLSYIESERRNSQLSNFAQSDVVVEFEQEIEIHNLYRNYSKNPFLINDSSEFEKILDIQAFGLKKRIEHINANKLVIGISGGLDSALALIVAKRSLDILGRSSKDILAITMPCFGTTDRTKSNAYKLCECLGVSFKEIDIGNSVKQHFVDIGQDENVHDAAYENSQARERTQILMDVANMVGGIVVGTGDLSELALGWATYNGDHMSMYAVNAGIPKTVVKALVRYFAECSAPELKEVLLDIVDTPVSPELLPASDDGEIKQKTEDLVGPYQLHDFYIYHTLKNHFSPKKIYRIACSTFANEYSDDVILYWLKVFVRRFFTQQFKRSCMPDGPKVFSVSLSPRGDYMMPTDASYNIWLKQLENL